MDLQNLQSEIDQLFAEMIDLQERKVLEIVKYLEEHEGIQRSQLERVHAPIGLEIGAITPEEIAVSVVAEMIAVRRGALQDAKAPSKSILAVS